MGKREPDSDVFDEILSEVNPAAPPEEAVDEIVQIAEEHDVGDQALELVNRFIDHNEIHPDKPPAVILRSGHQVLAEGDDEEVLENTVNSIIGESIISAREKEMYDDETFYSTVTDEIIEEVEHVVESTHEITVRALLRILLFEKVVDKRDEIYKDVYPNLRSNPEKVADTIEDTKAGMVLLLGKDTEEGLERLKTIEETMWEKHERNCILLKEQPEFESQGFINKLLLYSTLARYIIVEHTFPSGHLLEIPYVDDLESVVVFLQEEGEGASRVADRMINKDEFVRRFRYEPDYLEETLEQAVEWAEEKVEENKQMNVESYDWYE